MPGRERRDGGRSADDQNKNKNDNRGGGRGRGRDNRRQDNERDKYIERVSE